MDALKVGQTLLSGLSLPEPPEVPGFSDLAWHADGGFGRVWSARREADGTIVALKISRLSGDAAAERLDGEAASLQALDHPNIVRLHTITFLPDATPVLVMEFVDGPNLTAMLPRGGLEFDQALQIFLPVLDAVAHAHKRGIIHRDLKPSNILLDPNGKPKVTDFGLAQPLSEQKVAFSLTQSGFLAGTIEYIAPERYESDASASPAADIYALGIILYELLTGHPPRGAWLAPSQIKRLDVRLDALILHAIDASPERRLSSALEFKKQLEDIRDTRPRFAGTPLITRAVRASDCLWTCAGLYFLACGFCSLLGMNNSKVPGIFDLTFGHSKLLGGYWAVWTLSLGLGMVWLWQALRLWRFRHIPIREALPSPFGLRLGHTTGTLWLVGINQVICAWAPLLYLGWIYSQCWFWAGVDDSPWDHVLAITRWGSEQPVSQWTWDPSGMFSGDEFWIREMQQGLSSGKNVLVDRQSFFVVTQPLLMSLGLAAIALGLCVTVVCLWCEWRRRRRAGLVGFVAFAVSVFFSVGGAVTHEKRDRIRQTSVHKPAEGASIADSQVRNSLLFDLFARIASHDRVLPDNLALLFADQIQVAQDQVLDQNAFLRWVHSAPSDFSSMKRRMEALRSGTIPASSGQFGRVFFARVFDEEADGLLVRGSLLKTTCRGRRVPPNLNGWITSWVEEWTPLYQATPRPLLPHEAAEWLNAFLEALSHSDETAIAERCLPVMLTHDHETNGSENRLDFLTLPELRESLIGKLCSAIRLQPDISFSPGAKPTIRPLPGARQEIECPVLTTHRNSSKRESVWRIELVFSKGCWLALRLQM